MKDSNENVTGEVFIGQQDFERVMDFPNTWRLQKVGDRLEARGTFRGEGVKKQTILANQQNRKGANKNVYLVSEM
ncbi:MULTISPECIES: hypothetical protein [unclassified Bacillus (in: firmicutes)]|uniref:hypothetical protein n=1 Tax=unclassified Bacillus (in: firmicutes) TaxID=185979 RepID=UPI001BE64883|nr:MULTISPECIES: hypothetical protein [unclassified Bacillus (in: firmicutes)]MBT2616130.1 hypothetical protein [Bacillus sp. ISL-78]MBT2628420.1 hypothetical protein [Bacillus sp. ISL-101]